MNRVFPLFVGSGRSGTTLFRNVFDSHPQLAVTHEAHFVAAMARRRSRYEKPEGFDVDAFVRDLYANPNFLRQGIPEEAVRADLAATPPGSYAGAVRAVFALHAAAQGKPLYGDKTPGYVSHLALLGRLFPEARFVHIIRDGRDVALAYLDRSEWGPSTVAEAAINWRDRVSRGRKAGADLGQARYRETRYEDMIDDPEDTTLGLCDFLGLEYDEAMLRYHERGSEFIGSTKHPAAFAGLARPITKGMRDWRREMAPDDVALFETVAGDLLESLGYDLTGIGGGARAWARAATAEVAWQGRRVTARLGPKARRLRSRLATLTGRSGK